MEGAFNQEPKSNKDVNQESVDTGRRNFLKKALTATAGVAMATTGIEANARGRSSSDTRTEFEKHTDKFRMEVIRINEKIEFLQGLKQDEYNAINEYFASYKPGPGEGLVGGAVLGALALAPVDVDLSKSETAVYSHAGAATLSALTGGVIGGAAGLAAGKYFIPDNVEKHERYLKSAFFEKGNILTPESMAVEIQGLEKRKKELQDKLDHIKSETRAE